MKRKRFSKEFKGKIAIEALKRQHTFNDLSQEFGIHACQVNRWIKKTDRDGTRSFSQGKVREAKRGEIEKISFTAKFVNCRSKWTG